MLKRLSLFLAEHSISEAFNHALKIERCAEPMISKATPKQSMLYMHIPFCHDFCPFCSFHKFKYTPQSAKRYFKTLQDEMRLIHDKGYQFERLYVGGGTPLIQPDELFETLSLAKRLFPIQEISCESSPSTIHPSTLANAKGLIDRLSIGIQTFDDDLLKRMGRYERYGSSKELQEKVEVLKGVLPTISLDLIFNFPQQTKAMLQEDLRIARSLDVEQITTYPLMRSSMMKQQISSIFGLEQRTKEWELYQLIRDEMQAYTLNNGWSFAKSHSALSDEYVIHYPEYVGIGSGAFSFLDNRLYVNAYDLEEYDSRVYHKKHSIVAASPLFSQKLQLQYAFLLQLFGRHINIAHFNERFNTSLETSLRLELWWLEKNHAIVKQNGIITTTLFGDFLCVTMMKTFYSHMDSVRAYLNREFAQKVS